MMKVFSSVMSIIPRFLHYSYEVGSYKSFTYSISKSVRGKHEEEEPMTALVMHADIICCMLDCTRSVVQY